MAVDLDALIREIASRHGVALSRDDPILMLHTASALLVRDMATTQQQMLEEFRAQMTESGSVLASQTGDQLLQRMSAEMTQHTQTWISAMSQAGEDSAMRLRQAMTQQLSELEAQRERSHRLSMLALVASSIAWGAALGTVALAFAWPTH